MLELRDYQTQAVEAVYKFFRTESGNPCVVIPTGGGKTPVIAKFCYDAVCVWNSRVLVVAHVKELLEQSAKAIHKLCPTVDVGVYSAGLKQRDTKNPVVVAGIQSVYNKAAQLGVFDLVIVDEAHLIPESGDGQYRKLISDLQELNPDLRVIGLTATPYRLSSGAICTPEGVLNKICYEVSVKVLINRGFLSKMTNKAGESQIDTSKLKIVRGEFDQDQVEAEFDEVVFAATQEVELKTVNRKSVLVFCQSISHAKRVASIIRDGKDIVDLVANLELEPVKSLFDNLDDEVNRAVAADYLEENDHPTTFVRASLNNQITVGEIYGDTPDKERTRLIKEFREGKLKYLVNVNVLTTGFDAPNVDCVVLMRATVSAGLSYQMIGRGFRICPGKQDCIAEGQLVLTDVGLVPIEKVQLNHKVWDGNQFVNHAGVICKGYQDVITYCGLTATPDHKVWTNKGWMSLGDAKLTSTPIHITGDGSDPIHEAAGCFRRDQAGQTRSGNTHNAMQGVRERFAKDARQRSTRIRWMSKMWEKTKQIEAMSWGTEVVVDEVHCCQTAMHKSERSSLPGLRSEGNSVRVCVTECNGTMDHGQPWTGFKLSNRSNRQQPWLCSGKSQTVDRQPKSFTYTKANAQRQDTPNEKGSSRDPLRGFNIAKPIREGDDLRADHQPILPVLTQAKRRVWDILNAGPLHRFTCEGLLVSNCLVLDFGENIQRHGPVDCITPKQKKGEKNERPGKICPNCRTVVSAGVMVCPDCGNIWESSRVPTHNRNSDGESDVVSGEPKLETYDVTGVSYKVHLKKGGDVDTPKTLRVEYQVSLTSTISEWICIEHPAGSFAHGKALQWWQERCLLPIPGSTVEANAIAKQGWLAPTYKITVKTTPGEPFPEIKAYTLGTPPTTNKPCKECQSCEQVIIPDPGDDIAPHPGRIVCAHCSAYVRWASHDEVELFGLFDPPEYLRGAMNFGPEGGVVGSFEDYEESYQPIDSDETPF